MSRQLIETLDRYLVRYRHKRTTSRERGLLGKQFDRQRRAEVMRVEAEHE